MSIIINPFYALFEYHDQECILWQFDQSEFLYIGQQHYQGKVLLYRLS